MGKQTPDRVKRHQTIIYRKGKARFAHRREAPMYEDNQKKEIQIQMDEETAQGAYSNLAFITSNETEFVFDFIYVQPQQPRAKVRSRIIMSPNHAKKIMLALQDNMKSYESKFGEIKAAASDGERKIGF